MICNQAAFERGLAPPQEDFERPVWTRVKVDGVLFTNSAEYAAWDQSPCELFVCEQCWLAGCAMSNLAMAARLGDWLVFYPPAITDLPDWAESWTGSSNFLPRTLWFSAALWNRMQRECEAIPSATEFPTITRSGLTTLWLRQMPLDTYDPPDREDLPKLRDLLLVSDPMNESAALARIESILAWCDRSPGAEVAGRIQTVGEFAGSLNTLHLDGQPSPAWRCFTTGKELGLPVGDDLLFLLNEPL